MADPTKLQALFQANQNPLPVAQLGELQSAWFAAVSAWNQHVLRCFKHAVELQHNFLSHAADHHRTHIELAQGASLTDKYGKRAHDIDPERDV